MKTYIEVEATPQQSLAITRAIAILEEAGLELIGTRPKRRV